MEKQNIIKLFLKEKLQIDKESLDYITEKRIGEDSLKEMAGLLKKEGKYMVSASDIKKHEATMPPQEGQMVFLKRHVPLPESISIDDVVQDRIRTYEAMKKLLLYRWELTNMTSINRAGRNRGKFSLIGEVMEMDNTVKTMVLQDNTGTVAVSLGRLEEPQISQTSVGDFIGVLCENNGGVTASKIVYPDIPLFKDRRTPRENTAAAFVCGLSASGKGKNFDDIIKGVVKDYKRLYIFDFEEGLHNRPGDGKTVVISDSETGGKCSAGKAALVSVSGVNLLLCHKNVLPTAETQKNIMEGILKRRVVNCQNIAGMPISPLLIDPVPDIFVTNMGGNQQSSYKNTLLLSIGGVEEESIFWIIDLEKYECLKIPLT